jgi:hypothetical protein
VLVVATVDHLGGYLACAAWLMALGITLLLHGSVKYGASTVVRAVAAA